MRDAKEEGLPVYHHLYIKETSSLSLRSSFQRIETLCVKKVIFVCIIMSSVIKHILKDTFRFRQWHAENALIFAKYAGFYHLLAGEMDDIRNYVTIGKMAVLVWGRLRLWHLV